MKGNPIFLDFFNREASRASGRERRESLDLDIIRILVLAFPHGFSANISQLTEYGNSRPALFKTTMKLIEAGIIDATSNAATMDDFIFDRQQRYSHVSGRYPFYFTQSSELEGVQLGTRNDFSMTEALSSHLMGYKSDHFNFHLVRASKSDQSDFESGHHALASKVLKREGLAITRDLLVTPRGGSDMTPKQVSASSRIISALYMNIYATKRGLATCTGIPNFSYVDVPAGFPSFDYPILRMVIHALGENSNVLKMPIESIAPYYRSQNHHRFAFYLEAFLEAGAVSIRKKVNDPDSLPSMRALFGQFLTKELDGPVIQNLGNIDEFFEQAAMRLFSCGERIAKSEVLFSEKWRAYVPEQINGLVVITTATDSEDKALFAALEQNGFSRSRILNTGAGVAQEFVRSHNQKVVHLRTSAGSMGVNSAGVIIPTAMNKLDAKFIISTGICFGLKPKYQDAEGKKGYEQQYGDILYSNYIQDYETVRQGKKIELRGERLPAGVGLLQAVRIARDEADLSKFKVYEGLMLSGQKLVDDESFVRLLRSTYPDAIGGEMEGNALAASSIHDGRQWITIKGICDWGMDKEDNWQAIAAERACQLAVKAAVILLRTERS